MSGSDDRTVKVLFRVVIVTVFNFINWVVLKKSCFTYPFSSKESKMIFIGPLVCVSGLGFEKYAFSAHDNQHRLLYQQVSRGLNFVAHIKMKIKTKFAISFPYLVKLNDNGSYDGLREPIRKLENHYHELKIY